MLLCQKKHYLCTNLVIIRLCAFLTHFQADLALRSDIRSISLEKRKYLSYIFISWLKKETSK